MDIAAAAGNIKRREDQQDIAAAGNIKRREEHEDIAAGYIKRREEQEDIAAAARNIKRRENKRTGLSLFKTLHICICLKLTMSLMTPGAGPFLVQGA